MEANVMKSATVKSAIVAGIIANISKVRMNNSDYKFVTVLDKRGASTNVYFGKKSAETVDEDDVLTRDQLINAEFVLATNDVGETRIKLSLAGASDYTNLLSMFDDVEAPADYTAEVLKALKADMLTREESEALEEEDDDTEDEDAKALAEAKAIREAKKLAKAGK